MDFGSQYTHLIARRIRQLGVLAKIYPPAVSINELEGIKGLILSGGPQSVHDKTAIKYNDEIFDLKIPILGLRYGHQLIARRFGGEVKPGKTKEYGFAGVSVLGSTGLFSGLNRKEKVWMSHGDTVVKLPPGFRVIGRTADCPVAAMANEERKIYGLQFHPEVTHTEHGLIILENFVFRVCKCRRDWSAERYWKKIVGDVKRSVGSRNVFLLVSGGVDSTVAFAILKKILGKKRVFGLHINNGFMRLGESGQVKSALAKAGFDDLKVIDASGEFLAVQRDVIDPEKKREIIGRTFLKVKDEVMSCQKMDFKKWVLGQGTIYPDTIETGATRHADKIKTHHNRVKEILKLMKLGALVEPLAELYKDEVRIIGKKLGLPSDLINRHPFPGPGLAIRTLCSGGQSHIENQKLINRHLQAIIGKESHFRAAVLPLKSVGVQGDNRTYRHPVLIMGKSDWKKLGGLSIRITNELNAINRVVYLVYPEKINPKNLRLRSAYLDKGRLDLLRRVDCLVNQIVKKEKIYSEIWQFPVILAPLTLNGGETIILRPIQSIEAMTVNFYPMRRGILNKIILEIKKVPGIDLVLYDVTNKPPGTVEWE